MRIKKIVYLTADLIIILILSSLVVIGLNINGYNDIKSVYSPYYNGISNTNQVSLMINVYWGTEYIEPILDIFDRYNFHTTFFVGGMWADDNNDLLKKIISNGHELGNHGYFHKDHKTLSYKKNVDEIANCDILVHSITGVKMQLFAPPSGSMGKEMFNAVNDLGYVVIMWSKDTIDWRDHDVDLIFKRATTGINYGDFILMHPTKETYLALPKILDFYLLNDIEVTTVGNLLSINNY